MRYKTRPLESIFWSVCNYKHSFITSDISANVSPRFVSDSKLMMAIVAWPCVFEQESSFI